MMKRIWPSSIRIDEDIFASETTASSLADIESKIYCEIVTLKSLFLKPPEPIWFCGFCTICLCPQNGLFWARESCVSDNDWCHFTNKFASHCHAHVREMSSFVPVCFHFSLLFDFTKFCSAIKYAPFSNVSRETKLLGEEWSFAFPQSVDTVVLREHCARISWRILKSTRHVPKDQERMVLCAQHDPFGTKLPFAVRLSRPRLSLTLERTIPASARFGRHIKRLGPGFRFSVATQLCSLRCLLISTHQFMELYIRHHSLVSSNESKSQSIAIAHAWLHFQACCTRGSLRIHSLERQVLNEAASIGALWSVTPPELT